MVIFKLMYNKYWNYPQIFVKIMLSNWNINYAWTKNKYLVKNSLLRENGWQPFWIFGQYSQIKNSLWAEQK